MPDQVIPTEKDQVEDLPIPTTVNTSQEIIPEPKGDLILKTDMVEDQIRTEEAPIIPTPVEEMLETEEPVVQEAPPQKIETTPPTEPSTETPIVSVTTPVPQEAAQAPARGGALKTILIGLVLILVGVLVGVVLSSFTPSVNTTPPSPTPQESPTATPTPELTTRKIIDEKYQYELDVPVSWKEIEHNSNFDFQRTFAATDSSNFEVLVSELPAKSTLEKYLADQDKLAKTAYEGKPSKSVISTEKTEVAGLPAIEREEEFLAAGFVGRVIYFASEKYVYSLSFVPGASSTLVQQTSVYAAKKDIVESFRLILNKRTLKDCPKGEYVNCMPGPGSEKRPECETEFLDWAKANCPGFKGAAL